MDYEALESLACHQPFSVKYDVMGVTVFVGKRPVKPGILGTADYKCLTGSTVPAAFHGKHVKIDEKEQKSLDRVNTQKAATGPLIFHISLFFFITKWLIY